MQLPPKKGSSEIYLSYGDYAEGSLEAWVECGMPNEAGQKAAITTLEELKAAASRLRRVDETSAEAQRRVAKARAAFVVADRNVDQRTLACADAVYNSIAMRNRNDPTYVQIIGSSRVTDLTHQTRTEQPEHIDQMLTRLGQAEDFPGKADHTQLITEANTYAKAKRDALRSAEHGAQAARDEIMAARQGLRDSLQRAYAQLLAVYPGRKDFVEGFFLKRSPKKTSQPVEEAPSEDVLATAPAPSNGVSAAAEAIG